MTVHHDLLALLTEGFQPTQVACDEAVVTVEVDLAAATGEQAGRVRPKRKPPKPPPFDLPTVVLKRGTLRLVYRHGPGRVETVEAALGAVLRPMPQKTYEARVDARPAGGESFEITAWVDTARGEMNKLSVPVEFVRRLLPADFRREVARYAPTGSISVARRDTPDSDSPAYVVDLAGLAAVLPKGIIPVHMVGLRGRIVVDTGARRISAEDVSCMLPELGPDARLSASGSYDGFRPDSPFELRADLVRAELPETLGDGLVEKPLALIRKDYDPRGPFDLAVTYHRPKPRKQPATAKSRKSRKHRKADYGTFKGRITLGGDLSGTCRYFPCRLDRLRGHIDFTDSQVTDIHVSGVHGKGRATVTGRVWDWTGYGLYDITVDARDVELLDDLRKAIDAAVGEFVWRDLKPRGQGNAVVTVTDTSHKAYPRTSVVLDLDGRAGITHAAFPYPLDAIRGTVVIDDTTVRIVKTTGRRGSATCTVDGSVTKIDTPDPQADLTVDVTNLPVDQALLSALGSDGAKVLRDLGAAGTVASARTRVTVSPGAETDYRVRAELGGVRIRHEQFPYEITHITGPIEVTSRHVLLGKLTGRHGKATIALNGKVLLTGKTAAIERLAFATEGLTLDDDLRTALPPEVRDVWGDLALGGTADVTAGTLRHPDPARPDVLDYAITARLNAVRAKPGFFPYAFTDVAGRVTVTPKQVTLADLTGRHGKARITAGGTILLTGKDAAIKGLALAARDLALDADLREALGPEGRRLWGDLAPAGTVDIPQAMLRHKTPGKDDALDYRILIEPHDASVTYVDFPRTVTGIRGRIEILPGQVKLIGLRAREGETTATLDGRIIPGAAGGAELALSARGVPVDKPLIAAMGKVAPKGVGHIKPGGTISVRLETLRLGSLCPAGGGPATRPSRDGKTPPRPWSAVGTVAFDDMGVDVGLGSKTLSGRFTGSGAGQGQDLEMDARLSLDEVLVDTRRITNLDGQLLKKRRGTILQIRDFSGRSYGGKLAGRAAIHLGDPITYQISLHVRGIQLAEMALESDPKTPPGSSTRPAAPATRKEHVKGLLSGELKMLAINGAPEKRRGSGKIHITEASISKLPILLELLHLVQLQLPGRTSFSNADVTYRLAGQTLIFEEIKLKSSAISFIGSGTLDLKSKRIRLTFVGNRIANWPSLSELVGTTLTTLFANVGRQFVEIRTTGTLAKPKTQTVLLRSLGDLRNAVKRLLSPSGGQDNTP